MTQANATSRLAQELKELRSQKPPLLHSIEADEKDLTVWNGLILPDEAPYNTGAFRVELTFPGEYPFKPPKVTFKTQIYHPNIDEKGQVCLPAISSENWKPATRTKTVLQRLLEMVNVPQPEHPLRPELAEKWSKDRAGFLKMAREHTQKHSEPRPG